MSPSLPVAVIVPVRLRRPTDPGDLATCLAALARCAPAPAECVVVDDGSDPPLVLPADRPAGTRLLRQAPAGPAAARNAGAAATTAPTLVFVDADVAVPADALARLVALLDAAPEAVAAWATVLPRHPHGGLISRYKLHSHRHFTLRLGQGPGPWSTPHLTTMLAAVRRPAFQAIGGFQARWDTVSIEDVELGRDLVARGGTLLLDPTLQVSHAHRFTLRSAARNDLHKLRRLVAASLARGRTQRGRTQGPPHAAADRRMWAYAAGVPLGVGAVASALNGRPALSASLLLALALHERDLLTYLAAEEGPAFAAAAVPLLAIERCTAAAAGALGLVDHLRARGPAGQRSRVAAR